MTIAPVGPTVRTVARRPMAASPGPAPRGAGWAFEFVWDGLRCLAHADGDELRLVTDAGRDVTSSSNRWSKSSTAGGLSTPTPTAPTRS